MSILIKIKYVNSINVVQTYINKKLILPENLSNFTFHYNCVYNIQIKIKFYPM